MGWAKRSKKLMVIYWHVIRAIAWGIFAITIPWEFLVLWFGLFLFCETILFGERNYETGGIVVNEAGCAGVIVVIVIGFFLPFKATDATIAQFDKKECKFSELRNLVYQTTSIYRIDSPSWLDNEVVQLPQYPMSIKQFACFIARQKKLQYKVGCSPHCGHGSTILWGPDCRAVYIIFKK